MNIIQIGVANADDHVRDFVYNNLESVNLYLIEPNIYSNRLIELVYSNLKNKKIYNIAITTFDGEIDMHFFDYESGNTQAASINKNHVERHNIYNLPIVTHKVVCHTRNTFLKDIAKLNEVEHLYVDTEGHDCDIVMSIDFTTCIIKRITFEYIHSDGPFINNGNKINETKNYLTQNGYFECGNDRTNGNITFCKNV